MTPSLADRPNCDFPDKILYVTKASAKKRIKRMRNVPDRQHMRPFRCGDHWHVGHMPRRRDVA